MLIHEMTEEECPAVLGPPRAVNGAHPLFTAFTPGA